jgi:hypothetical protein
MQAIPRAASLMCVLLLAGCAGTETDASRASLPPRREAMRGGPAASIRLHTGWYREHEGRGLFQPCGSGTVYRVAARPQLRSRARDFGLQPDTPVYVRLEAAIERDTLKVARVLQFGSTTPVRDCPLTGVVIGDDG